MDTGKASWPARDEFINLTRAYDAGAADACWQEIVKAYTGKSRHYHNLDHIAAMLRLSHQFTFASKEIAGFAIFYHDIIYKVPGSDNEHRSALMAAERLRQLAVPGAVIEQVCLFIEATKTHELVEVQHLNDLKLFLDFDLSILAADWDEYAVYLQNIRKEYRYFPDLLYYPGRNSFLKKMLDKEHIFHTAEFRGNFENKARQNLQRELTLRKK